MSIEKDLATAKDIIHEALVTVMSEFHAADMPSYIGLMMIHQRAGQVCAEAMLEQMRLMKFEDEFIVSEFKRGVNEANKIALSTIDTMALNEGQIH